VQGEGEAQVQKSQLPHTPQTHTHKHTRDNKTKADEDNENDDESKKTTNWPESSSNKQSKIQKYKKTNNKQTIYNYTQDKEQRVFFRLGLAAT